MIQCYKYMIFLRTMKQLQRSQRRFIGYNYNLMSSFVNRNCKWETSYFKLKKRRLPITGNLPNQNPMKNPNYSMTIFFAVSSFFSFTNSVIVRIPFIYAALMLSVSMFSGMMKFLLNFE